KLITAILTSLLLGGTMADLLLCLNLKIILLPLPLLPLLLLLPPVMPLEFLGLLAILLRLAMLLPAFIKITGTITMTSGLKKLMIGISLKIIPAMIPITPLLIL